MPFDIQRVYYLYDVPGGAERGGHAHKALHQFIIAMSGSFDVVLDDGQGKKRIHLNRSYYGLYVCPMIWRELDNFSSGSVCMVLASNLYDEADYYRDYEEFLAAQGGSLDHSFSGPKGGVLRAAAELDAAMARVLTGWYILGKEVEAFEDEFAAYCGATHCIGVANGLDALHLILRAMDIGPGDEVIVPSNTYIATWLAVSHCGATPVPVEPDERTFNIDPRSHRGGHHAPTRGIMPGPSLRPARRHGRDPGHCAQARPGVIEDARRRTARATRASAWARWATPRPGAFTRARISAPSATAAP